SRLRRRRLHHGVACRERAHSGRQSGDASRAHHDPRGDGARIFRAPPRAHRMGVGTQAFQLLVHRDRHLLSVRDRARRGPGRCAGRCTGADREARDRRIRARAHRNPFRQDAHLSRAGIPGHGVPARRARDAGQPLAGHMSGVPFYAQIINLMAALLLLLAFAMLAQRRVLSLIDLFALQGLALAISTAVVAWGTHQPHLYGSTALTLLLKVIVLPWILHRLIRRLDVRWDVEGLINIPITMLIGIVLVVFSFNLAVPISQLASTVTRSTLGI